MAGVTNAVQAAIDDAIRASEDRVARALADGIKIGLSRQPGVQVPYGTVVAVSGLSVQVTLDVDSSTIATTAPAHVVVVAGDRVAVLHIPPAGSLVVGKVG